jgi:DNA polymerase III epsilon subunit family exonuclease
MTSEHALARHGVPPPEKGNGRSRKETKTMIFDFLTSLFIGGRKASLDVDKLVFVDLETTGLFTNRCGILEVCLFNTIEGCFSTLVDVGQPIPARITEINGIDRDMIVGMPMFSEIAAHVHDRIKDKIVVGHNVEFDLKFLFHGFLQAGIHPQTVKYICTCKAERMKHGPTGNRLDECLRRRGIRNIQNHRALEDVNLLRQLFTHQMNERTKFKIDVFDVNKFHAITLREPEPMFAPTPIKRTSHSLKTFKSWGNKADNSAISSFNQLIEHACQDRVFDTDEMRRLVEIGIEKKVAVQQLKTALRGLIALYYKDGKISWDEFKDLEEVAKLFGFNSSVFYPIIKEVVPELKVVCFTNELVVKGKDVDRYEILFPWAVCNGFLPSDSVTKQTDIVVNCGTKTSVTGKIEKAISYGIDVKQISDFMKGKERLVL